MPEIPQWVSRLIKHLYCFWRNDDVLLESSTPAPKCEEVSIEDEPSPPKEDHIAKYVASIPRREYVFEDLREELISMMRIVGDSGTTLISFDLEGTHGDIDDITQVGVSVYQPKEGTRPFPPFIRLAHIILKYRFSRYPHSFNGERSLHMNLEQVRLALNELIMEYSRDKIIGSGICIVGHNMHGDVRLLKELGLYFGECEFVDTQRMLSITHGIKRCSLANSLRLIRQPYAFLHNAGNDAYYTMILCLCLADPEYRRSAGIDHQMVVAEYLENQDTQENTMNRSSQVFTCHWTKLRKVLRCHTI